MPINSYLKKLVPWKIEKPEPKYSKSGLTGLTGLTGLRVTLLKPGFFRFITPPFKHDVSIQSMI